MVKNLPTNAEDARDASLIPEWERSLGEGDGNPLQYSCLGNFMDRGAWRATDPWSHKESDRTEQLSMHVWGCYQRGEHRDIGEGISATYLCLWLCRLLSRACASLRWLVSVEGAFRPLNQIEWIPRQPHCEVV